MTFDLSRGTIVLSTTSMSISNHILYQYFLIILPMKYFKNFVAIEIPLFIVIDGSNYNENCNILRIVR